MEKSDKRFTFRLPQELRRRVEVQAQKEKRSTSNLIVKIVSDYLDEVEKEQEKKDQK